MLGALVVVVVVVVSGCEPAVGGLGEMLFVDSRSETWLERSDVAVGVSGEVVGMLGEAVCACSRSAAVVGRLVEASFAGSRSATKLGVKPG